MSIDMIFMNYEKGARPAYDHDEATQFIINRFKQPEAERSFLNANYQDGREWASEIRKWVKGLMLFDPPDVPLDAVMAEEEAFDGYKRLKYYYMAAEGCKSSAYVLIPDGLKAPAPAIVALHDHSGQFFYGKEKLTEHKNPGDFLNYVQLWRYGGRGIASELARRGYVVVVPDALGWGERGPWKESWLIPGMYDYLDAKNNLPQFIERYDKHAGGKFNDMCSHILYAGYTYPGIAVHNDMKSVDLLLTIPEVDKNRIGCTGLSMGGMRTTLLMAMDERICCGVPVGFPALYPYSLPQFNHSVWLVVPGLWQSLPFPDLAALAMPRKLLIMYCENDALFELHSMKASVETTSAAYKKAGLADNCKYKGWPVGHQYDYDMQEYAFKWLGDCLNN